MTADTPPGRIHAATAACRACGRCPISRDPDAVPFSLPSGERFSDVAHRRERRI